MKNFIKKLLREASGVPTGIHDAALIIYDEVLRIQSLNHSNSYLDLNQKRKKKLDYLVKDAKKFENNIKGFYNYEIKKNE